MSTLKKEKKKTEKEKPATHNILQFEFILENIYCFFFLNEITSSGCKTFSTHTGLFLLLFCLCRTNCILIMEAPC